MRGRLGVLDIGASSVHLLVADLDGGELREVERDKQRVRLGAGTLARGWLDDDAIARGLAAIAGLAARARAGGAERLVCVATSALREARNGRTFIERARDVAQLDVEILSGEEEGRLIYRGACAGRGGRHAVIDIGGGSVELVAGRAGEPRSVHSLPLGVLRLREALIPADGYVSARAVEAIAGATRATAAAAVADVAAGAPEAVVFTSGTARAIARLAEHLAGPFASSTELRAEAIARLVVILTKLRPSGLVSLGVSRGRTDTIAVGAVVMHTLVELLGVPACTVSERTLAHGVALRELERRAPAAAALAR